ncbi:MAG: hypothetical protein ABIP38_07615 [Steroidobacteraceae bacterium]
MRAMATALLVLVLSPCVRAEVEASLDLRLIDSNGRNTFLDGGLGKLRYDADDDGVQLGRARLAWRGSPGGDWHASVDLSAWSLDDHNAIDVTEAWLEWRPVPSTQWRSNLKIGAFYPPISLEHRAPGWTNPYTISSSALNTWVGEELRTIGVAYGLDHLGIAAGGHYDFGAQAAVFGWNDPAGVIVAFRGFSLNDRQTPLFGRIGTFAFGDREQRVLFSEIDNRPGYHVSAYLTHDSGVELRALHYDNRADPGDYNVSISDFAWRTKFDSLGARYDGPAGFAVIAQWLKGETFADEPSTSWNFKAAFLLVAREFGHHRLAVRYDDFHVHPGLQPNYPLNPEHGDALTLGWTWTISQHVELMGEWMRIDSTFRNRFMLGEDPHARERIVQLALRLSL